MPTEICWLFSKDALSSMKAIRPPTPRDFSVLRELLPNVVGSAGSKKQLLQGPPPNHHHTLSDTPGKHSPPTSTRYHSEGFQAQTVSICVHVSWQILCSKKTALKIHHKIWAQHSMECGQTLGGLGIPCKIIWKWCERVYGKISSNSENYLTLPVRTPTDK